MPTPRKYATNAERQAAYRARCAVTAPAYAVPPSVPGPRRWGVLTDQARKLLDGVSEEMASYWDARSEAWQNSERGERLTEQMETLAEILDLLRDQNQT